MKALKAFAMGGALLFAALPAMAQESSWKRGGYQDVSSIELMPGQFENYMDYLAKNYKPQQDFAKSKGWVTGYSILVNLYRRDGEPHLFLVTSYPRQYSNAEIEAQEKEFERFTKQTSRQAVKASGERMVMRKEVGDMQLQELILK